MKKSTEITDEELMIRLKTGNSSAAFLEVYNRYHASLYAAACKRCSSAEVAEEIVQDLFINLWKNRETLVIHSSLSGYLFTAIRNLVLNQLQKEAVRNRFNKLLRIDNADYDNSTEEIVLANDLLHNLDRKLHVLPDKCRSVFELSRKQYKSNKQIAHELCISEKTVENHITRAIKVLRVSLQHILLPVVTLFFTR